MKPPSAAVCAVSRTAEKHPAEGIIVSTVSLRRKANVLSGVFERWQLCPMSGCQFPTSCQLAGQMACRLTQLRQASDHFFQLMDLRDPNDNTQKHLIVGCRLRSVGLAVRSLTARSASRRLTGSTGGLASCWL